jgi:hypothetical protein
VKKWHFPKFNVMIIQKIVDQREKKITLDRETSGEYADNIIFLFVVGRFLANQKPSFFKKFSNIFSGSLKNSEQNVLFHNYHRFPMLKHR